MSRGKLISCENHVTRNHHLQSSPFLHLWTDLAHNRQRTHCSSLGPLSLQEAFLRAEDKLKKKERRTKEDGWWQVVLDRCIRSHTAYVHSAFCILQPISRWICMYGMLREMKKRRASMGVALHVSHSQRRGESSAPILGPSLPSPSSSPGSWLKNWRIENKIMASDGRGLDTWYPSGYLPRRLQSSRDNTNQASRQQM